ncbi:MAG TPA: pyruvate, phosphate dikinase [Dehalococcoidia bacterium]|nr:pyruvate, phosphate dikinase [Dehalococcoidia bacterium]
MATSTGVKKWVYLFPEGNASQRDLLGGKGAGLSEMTNAGLPVPPGFTITTEACNSYYDSGRQFPPGMWDQVLEALRTVERETGKTFGDPRNPLLVSVRSGAKFSMPGMMDTVLNLGLNEETLQGLIAATGNERFGYDAYRRFIQMFGKIVLDIDGHEFDRIFDRLKEERGATHDTDLDAAAMQEAVRRFKALVRERTGRDFPTDPVEQLRLAIEAVFASWNNRRAIDYRNFNKIPHDLGTAVNVVAMVFGNLGETSGTGVAFTRDPSSGEPILFGEYLVNAQGEDVVAGIRTPQQIAQLKTDMPDVYAQFEEIARRLERHYRDAQDLEFTVERGKLYMLQTRSAKRSAKAAVRMAVEMANEGLITREEAVLRVEPAQINQLLLPRLDEKAKSAAIGAGRLLARGLNASPGAATGQAVFDADRAAELGRAGEAVILVRPETSPDDVHGMLVARGILTARGGATSHAAVVARGLGLPCVAGCEDIRVDEAAHLFRAGDTVVREGDQISIDGSTGEVFQGTVETIEPVLEQEHELLTLLGWADEQRQLGVWANADYPKDAAKAIEFGAEGIGLCRTEHMFFEEDRLPLVRQMILASYGATGVERDLRRLEWELENADQDRQADIQKQLVELRAQVPESPRLAQFREALTRLEAIQRGDFREILRVMQGKPVIIRLLDPPLHEFLPNHEDLLLEVAELRRNGRSAELAEKEQLLATVNQLRESNPMLGLRGVRLGILFPEIYEMQVRAILEAAADLTAQGVEVHPEIMIPLIGHVNELRLVRERLERVARKVEASLNTTVPYRFGTMIEVPRAALTADEIAEVSDFFSFGTNDLTQTTYGYSRDDAEGKFLLQYVEEKILPANPFQELDRTGVGRLIALAVELGRRTQPDLKIGICGEHGGDPSSIEFCQQTGLDYVSCSPFRVPVARLAAAQAALAHGRIERDR